MHSVQVSLGPDNNLLSSSISRPIEAWAQSALRRLLHTCKDVLVGGCNPLRYLGGS